MKLIRCRSGLVGFVSDGVLGGFFVVEKGFVGLTSGQQVFGWCRGILERPASWTFATVCGLWDVFRAMIR